LTKYFDKNHLLSRVLFDGYAGIEICSKLPREKMLSSYFFVRPFIVLKRRGAISPPPPMVHIL